MRKTTKKAAATDTVKDSRDLLIEDLKRVINDAQSLATEAKDASGTAIHEKIEAVQENLSNRMKALRKSGSKAMDGLEQQTENVEEIIRKHPWRSVAVAVAAGVLADRIFIK